VSPNQNDKSGVDTGNTVDGRTGLMGKPDPRKPYSRSSGGDSATGVEVVEAFEQRKLNRREYLGLMDGTRNSKQAPG